MVIEQYTVYWVSLDPTQGREVQKTRPCVVISPNEINSTLSTVIIAPITSTDRNIPTRVEININNKQGFVMLEQIRTIDKSRLQSRTLGRLTAKQIQELKQIIHTMLVL